MIKVKETEIEHVFSLQPGDIVDLTIENPVFYRKFISEVLIGDNERIIITDDGSPISFEKHSLAIPDPFDLNPNSKKILAAVYKKIDHLSMTPERRESLKKVNEQIASLLDDLSSDFEGNVVFNEELVIPQLLGLLDFKFNYDDSTFFSSFVSYIRAWREAMDLKLVFAVNLLPLFDEKNISNLSKEFSYCGISLINVSYFHKPFQKIKSVIVDKDLCEIYQNDIID